MNHPDESFSRFYCATDGLQNEKCLHVARRNRTGPTGRKTFYVLSDSCERCGRILKTAQDINWKTYFWIRRWNERTNKNIK